MQLLSVELQLFCLKLVVYSGWLVVSFVLSLAVLIFSLSVFVKLISIF